ncbi:MAG: hypothetical protein VYC39_13565 [Myxococcota bacterium]|nr:hypothetical protein [Myxococcota bacterium]
MSQWACDSTQSRQPTSKITDGIDAGVINNEPDANPINVDPDADVNPEYTWWQDIQPIVSEKCQLCHANPPQYGATRPLVEYSHTQRTASTGAPVHAEMVQRIYAPSSRMPPPSQPQLTEEEKTIIQTWSENGAPEGVPPSDAGVPEDAGTNVDAGSEDPDSGVPPGPGRAIEIRATNTGTSAPYTLPVQRTNYVCWSVRVPAGGGDNEHAVRFEHIIDNTAKLHHMLLFKNRGDDVEAGPFGCDGLDLNWDMISGWAPGRQPEQLPPGVGVRLEEGDQIILQAHYDDVRMQNVTDSSGIRLVTVDQPGLTPAGIMWAGGPWYPAINGSNVRKRGTCEIRTPITIFQNFPHMHEFGLRITLELKRAGTSNWEMLTEVPAWDFEDQPNLPIRSTEQQLNVGDQLRTSCWWDTQGRDISFGESTSDEMCFNFIYHYPILSNPTLACAALLR